LTTQVPQSQGKASSRQARPSRSTAVSRYRQASLFGADHEERRSSPPLFRTPQEVFTARVEVTWSPGTGRAFLQAELVERTSSGSEIPVEWWCRPCARSERPEELLEEPAGHARLWIAQYDAPF
jgi:hypothetical protein